MADRSAGDQDAAEREFLPTFADLIDRLTIDQIKETLLDKGNGTHAAEIKRLEHDIDGLIQESGLGASARVFRIVTVLAQVNLHIWHCKDQMAAEPDRYDEWLRLAHQLNGIRNRMKNLLTAAVGHDEASAMRTNTDTDDLQGWDVSI